MTAGTATPAEALARLAELDAALERLRASLSKDDDAATAAAKRLADAEAARAAAVETLQAAQVRQAEAEKDILHHEERRKKEADRMDRVRTPKEQRAIEKELEMIGAKKAKAEARALEAIAAVEAAQKELAGRRAEEEAARGAEAEARAAAGARRAEVEAEVAALEGRRAEVIAGLPAPIRSHYEHLRGRGVAAIAPVDEGACGGCRRVLPPNLAVQARAGKAPRCPGCARILVPPRAADAPADESPAA